MSRFFKPYEGKKSYLFISYSHRQSDTVVDIIRLVHEKRYRLWYDEGIPAGNDWPSNIAQHMQSSAAVIFFLSREAMESPNCFSEIRTAVRQGKPILVLRLDNAEPDAVWQELLKGRKILPVPETPEAGAEEILSSSFLRRRFRRSWKEFIPWRIFGFLASAALFLGTLLLFGSLVTGRWSPVAAPEMFSPQLSSEETLPELPVDLGEAERFFAVSFPDTLQERALRNLLDNPSEDVYAGDLAQIQTLYLCGNMALSKLEGVEFDDSGKCRVNGAPMVTGPVRDLRLIADMPRLEELALLCQPLENLSAINGHVLLRELNLAGSSISTLDSMQDLPSLATLHIEHTGVSDLRPLEKLPNLKTVAVSADMLPLQWSNKAGFDVVLVE